VNPDSPESHLVLAIDTKSQSFGTADNLLGQTAGRTTNPLSWLGSSVALYADEDPFWADLAKAKDTDKFMEENFPRLPVALRAESNNPLKLATFLTAIRAYSDQSAPNLVLWETRNYAGQTYVCITPNKGTMGPDAGPVNQLAVYYAPTPAALPLYLRDFSAFDFALTFENGGVTGSALLQRRQ
jgi:hypothetical protein